MPDVFVPVDSIYFSGLLSDIAYSGTIRDYCFEFVEQNRVTLSKYNEMQFIRKFLVSDQMVNRLLERAASQNIEFHGKVLKKIAPQIKRRIKAQLARTLFGEDAAYKVLLEDDADFERAMKELSPEASKVIVPKKSKGRK